MKISNQIFENNDVNRTGISWEDLSPGRCSLAQQWGPVCHRATGRVKWNKEVNKIVMECFYRSKPSDEKRKSVRGYRKKVQKMERKRNV